MQVRYLTCWNVSNLPDVDNYYSQVVEQLESQVSKEKQRLQAMMSHLQMKQSPDTTTGHNHNPQFPDTVGFLRG